MPEQKKNNADLSTAISWEQAYPRFEFIKGLPMRSASIAKLWTNRATSTSSMGTDICQQSGELEAAYIVLRVFRLTSQMAIILAL